MGFVRLIDEPASDLKVVNAARVSFAKKSTVFEDRDAKLINYLARNNHWTPFAHVRALTPIWFSDTEMLVEYANAGGMQFKPDPNSVFGFLVSHSLAHLQQFPELACNYEDICPVSTKALTGRCGLGARTRIDWSLWPEEEPVTIHIKMPVFVARQWMRSNVGIVYNEVSRRYVDDPPEFHEPLRWRKRPDKSIKQGSSDETLDHVPVRPACYDEAYDEYSYLLGEYVAPEQARIVLPLSMYTEVWMTCSLRALARVLRLRLDPHAQWEIREYAKAVREVVSPRYPMLEKLLAKPEVQDGIEEGT